MTAADRGTEAYALIERLYPICRSITGNGLRETLSVIAEHVPLGITEVRSGTKVLDWVIPDEWNVDDAYIADATGRRFVDFRASNLHVVNYSEPVRETDDARRATPSLAHASRSTRLRAVSNLLLRAHVGVLPLPAATRRAPVGRPRRRDRVDTRPRLPNVRGSARPWAHRRTRS